MPAPNSFLVSHAVYGSDNLLAYLRATPGFIPSIGRGDMQDSDTISAEASGSLKKIITRNYPF